MKKFLFIWMLSPLALQAQEQWSLVKCIRQAQQENLNLQSGRVNVLSEEINLKENKYRRLPDLNGNINMGWSIGRNIDPTSNDFITQDILNGNYGLSSSVILFQAGMVNKSITQSKINLSASKEEYMQSSNDISLQVASQYLNVLLADERLEIAGKNLEAIRQQMEQIQKMISAGGRPEADLYEIKSQVARSEQGVVSAENALDLAWLSLKQSLRLRSDLEMSLEPLSEEQLRNLESESYTYENLYEYSSVNQPGMKAAKLRLEAAKLGEGIARAAFYPSLFGNISAGSRYSNVKLPSSYSIIGSRAIPGIRIDGKDVVFEEPLVIGTNEKAIPFTDQFDQYLGYSFSVSMNIPIANNYRTRASVKRAKLASERSRINFETQGLNLSQNISQAIANVKAAIKEYDAANSAYEAARSSQNFTQKRFEIGATNLFELNQSQNNLQTAELSLLISKYDLIFKQKVLDFYAGKEIKL